ncbi:MAG: CAP domain-containing protein [bacterium]|nr:CAP domain-containing protein [bacterium]
MNFLSKISHNLKLFFIPCDENHFRPRSLESYSFGAYIAVALVLKLGVISILTFLPRAYFFADVTSATLVALTNESRKAQGLGELNTNSLLAKAAQEKAQDMVAKNYFAHESPDGKSPWYWFRNAGYRYLYAGENLAKDFVDSRAVVEAWLASPLHRANILNGNYQEIGIAVASAPSGDPERPSIVVVQMFGKSSAPVPVATPVVSPKVSPIKTPLPSAAPSPSQTPQATPSATPFPEASDVATVAVEEAPLPASLVQAETAPTASFVPESAVAGTAAEQEVIKQAPPRHLVFVVNLMTASERVIESSFLAFLAFVILASILNIFIRIDIQHKDLIARALILVAFFSLLASLNGQAFLDYIPQVL